MQPQYEETQGKSSFEILRLTPSSLDANLLQAAPKQGLAIGNPVSVDLEQGMPFKYSICTSGEIVSVIFSTATDNSYTRNGRGSLGQVGERSLQMITDLNNIFK